MGVKQLDAEVAMRLNLIESQIATRVDAIKQEQEALDALWQEAYAIFDEEFGEKQGARFICDDGYLLGRDVRRQSPTVNAEQLIKTVEQHASRSPNWTPLRATRLLKRVIKYVPVVDQAALAQEVIKGRIPSRVVDRCVTRKDNIIARARRELSKRDKLNLERGIIESPTIDEEEEWAS